MFNCGLVPSHVDVSLSKLSTDLHMFIFIYVYECEDISECDPIVALVLLI